jgi:uncharacterized OB-fold protein
MTDGSYPEGPLGPDEITAESPFTLPGFFDALADGDLLAAECHECDAVLVPPRPACHDCGSRRVSIAEQPRTGTVYSYTEVRRPPTAFEDLAPLTVAIVELDSGTRLTGRVDAAYDDIEIGTPVELTVRAPDVGEEAMLSYEREWPLHVFEIRD